MSVCLRDPIHRLIRNPSPEQMEDELENEHENVPPPPPVRTMRDHLNPTRITQLSCIVAPAGVGADVFTVKPPHLQMLPHFHGMHSENPYSHIHDFDEVVHTIVNTQAQLDSERMKLFPFSSRTTPKVGLIP